MHRSAPEYRKTGNAPGSGKALESSKEQDFRGQQDTGCISTHPSHFILTRADSRTITLCSP